MIAGGVYVVRPAASPALSGCPVLWLGGGLCDTGAARVPISPDDLSPARLWLARGRDWQGPFPGWRAARAALQWPGEVLGGLEAAGRGKPLGASYMAGGWRYRLAYGGDDPPARFGT